MSHQTEPSTDGFSLSADRVASLMPKRQDRIFRDCQRCLRHYIGGDYTSRSALSRGDKGARFVQKDMHAFCT